MQLRTATALGGAATLGGLAILNNLLARHDEAQSPPIGRFLDIEDATVHYLRRGSGRPLGPLLGRAVAEKVVTRIFAPNAVPPAFWDGFPVDLCLRPGQLWATAEDVAVLRPSVRRLMPRYGEVAVPVFIMAGSSDAL